MFKLAFFVCVFEDIFFLPLFETGVVRLANISLHDPVSVSISEEANPQGVEACARKAAASGPPLGVRRDDFAVPEKLQQSVVVVPSKLKLVTLAAFLLGKCKVSVAI